MFLPPACPPPAMPGSSIKVLPSGCPTGHRKPEPYNLMTSECNAERWSLGLITQGTARSKVRSLNFQEGHLLGFTHCVTHT